MAKMKTEAERRAEAKARNAKLDKRVSKVGILKHTSRKK